MPNQLGGMANGQRIETLPLAAGGDLVQHADRREPADRNRGKRRSIRNLDAQWATDVLSDPAASMAQCMLEIDSECKRCGPVVTGFRRLAFPNFRPAVAPSTDLRFNF